MEESVPVQDLEARRRPAELELDLGLARGGESHGRELEHPNSRTG